MKAIIVHTADEKPVLNWEDVPDVTIRPNECLVTVRATAVNRADLSQARGNYPPPPGASDILGLEMAGEIAAVGADVTGWQVGDRVCALLPGGGYAEQAAVPGGMLLPLPEHWSFAQGAAVPEVWLTAFVNLFLEGKLQAGETALIHAGASGVGTAAIQLAKAAGATVYVTAGATHKLDRCRELGADLAINYKEQDFSAEILAVSDGVDVILDPVGGGYLARNAEVCRRFGRIVNIGLLGGAQAQINMAHVLRKRLTIIGSTLRTRALAEKIAITKQFAGRFWEQLLSGELQIVIDSQFPVEQAQQAHDYVAQNRNIGKVVLTVA